MMKLSEKKKAALTMQLKNMLHSVIGRVVLIVLALVLATVFLGLSGYPWGSVIDGIGRGLVKDFGGTIKAMIFLLITALAVCMPFKMGFFNLGIDGQYYMGALACTVVALWLPNLSRVVGIPFLFLIGGIAGMLFALIPALMKVLWNADEVVSTLLLNFIAELVTEAVILGPLKTPNIVNSSEYVSESYFLSSVLGKANTGLYIGIVLAFLLAFVMNRMRFGYELKVTGENPEFARYGGIRSKTAILKVMMVSGFISGIAGVVMILGVQHRFVNLFNSAQIGFSGIVVAILANNNPIGCIFAAFFFACLDNGMTNMQRITNIPAATADIVQAIIVLAISATFAAPYIKQWLKRYKKDKAVSEPATLPQGEEGDAGTEVSR